MQILREQAVSMDTAVAKKLSFLQSDEAFENNYLQNVKYDGYREAFNNGEKPKIPLSKSVNQPTCQHLNDEHKQNISARLAALRGLSMPGDYITKR